MPASKPTQAELLAAYGKKVPDIIAPNLHVLFCGINPSLYSVAIGHHFGRPGNRFWKALHLGGFTPRLFDPSEDASLIELGLGISNVVDKGTARADELSPEEFLEGAQNLTKKIQKYKPKVVAFLGIGAYRSGFQKPKASMGLQETKIGDSAVWVLPNPSGLNAHFDAEGLGRLFTQLKDFVTNMK